MNYEKLFREYGLLWTPHLDEFMRQYGGKKIKYRAYNGMLTEAEFGTPSLLKGEETRIEAAAVIMGEQVAPIGATHNLYMPLFLSESGRLIGFEEGSWFSWGWPSARWEQSLKMMLNGACPEELDTSFLDED